MKTLKIKSGNFNQYGGKNYLFSFKHLQDVKKIRMKINI